MPLADGGVAEPPGVVGPGGAASGFVEGDQGGAVGHTEGQPGQVGIGDVQSVLQIGRQAAVQPVPAQVQLGQGGQGAELRWYGPDEVVAVKG